DALWYMLRHQGPCRPGPLPPRARSSAAKPRGGVSAPAVVEREAAFVLEPLGDFSLRAAARFWEGFTPASHTGLDAEGHLHMAFPVEGNWITVGVCVQQAPSADLVVNVYGDVDIDQIKDQTARVLSLDVDGRAFAEIGKRDPVAGEVLRRYPGLRPV